MPRRNSSPVQRSSRRRNNTYRRGATISVLTSTGKWVDAKVLHSNPRVTTILDLSTGETTWIPTASRL